MFTHKYLFITISFTPVYYNHLLRLTSHRTLRKIIKTGKGYSNFHKILFFDFFPSFTTTTSYKGPSPSESPRGRRRYSRSCGPSRVDGDCGRRWDLRVKGHDDFLESHTNWGFNRTQLSSSILLVRLRFLRENTKITEVKT